VLEKPVLKQIFVDALKPGQSVDDVFIVSDRQLAQKKNGESFLTFQLSDRTGAIKAIAWDPVVIIQKVLTEAIYFRVSGKVNTYQGANQVIVHHVMAIEDSDTIRFEDFLPATEKDIEGMFRRLKDLLETVTEPHLSALLKAFFEDNTFVKQFKKAPAAKKMHHAYLGGLLEHTLSIATLSQIIASHYEGLNGDLLLTGAVLHDIGKIHEFSYETQIDYSDSGRLLSHIVIGTQMFEKKLQTLDNFPEELSLLIKHMIVSHHGTREFGSPQPPMTLEAVVLNYLDDLDAKVTGVRAFMKRDPSDASWTPYHRLMDRFFYKGTGEN
jgi:3'-5' exoribonuclease